MNPQQSPQPPDQRERLIAGVAIAIAEQGYAEFTVAHVLAAAGISRRTFYEHFANKQEAVLVAHDIIFERFMRSLRGACKTQDEWPLKVKAAIGATIDWAVANPAEGQLLTLDVMAPSAEVARGLLDSGDQLAALLSGGRQYGPRGDELPELIEKALVGAIFAVVAARLRDGEPELLHALEAQLVELTLMPFVGPEEAARVAAS